ncbi:hypothetical protein AB4Z42_00325 [Mycobacterium sp. 2YAF39]|uniref:hypothetical protein n=1 Tax=Mycobacterium sp. 2YAF39 TaxID=3233033 RepID=UPI003F9EB3F4
MSVRSVFAALTAVILVVSSCSGDEATVDAYDAQTAAVGESLAFLGWNMSVSNMRFEGDNVLIDVDAAPSGDGPHADPKDLRFGLYGALAHPLEAPAIGSCRDVSALDVQPLSTSKPDRMTGTVCLGPQRDQSQVRGVYVYSTGDRMAGTTTAYPAAFPVGLPSTKDDGSSLTLKTTSVDAFREDGSMLDPTALGDPDAFTGGGYMLLGLQIDGLATQYRDISRKRGGPTMVLMAPTLPVPGLSHACDVYGASVLVLPERSREAVQIAVTLCTQGDINTALLYPTLSLVGTHAALWTTHE